MIKTILVLSLLVQASSFAWATSQDPICLPDTAEAQSWPVKVLYLHGLYPATGEFGPENSYRAALKASATKHHFRIAVPVSPSVHNNIRSWNTISLTQMEAMAASVCRVDLAANRALVGFSNGGYAARRVAQMPCDETKAYSKIVAIGAPSKNETGACGAILTNVTPHKFPPAKGIDYYIDYLETDNLSAR